MQNRLKKFLVDLMRPRQKVTKIDPPRDYLYYTNTTTENVTGEFYELDDEPSDPIENT